MEFANRIFLSIYVLLLPLSALFFLRRTGGNRWYSIAAFVSIYNYSVSWGFVGFFFAIPLVLVFAGLLAGYFERCGAIKAAVITLLLVGIFFVHALAAIFALLLLVACGLLGARNSPVVMISRLAPAVPLVLLLALWLRSGEVAEGLARFLGNYYAGDYFRSLLPRAHIIFIDNYHLFEGRLGALAGSALTVAILSPCAVGIVRARGGSDRGKLHRSVPFALFACSLACFLLLPHEIPRQAILYQRFSTLLLLSFVLLSASLGPAGGGRSGKIIFTAAACAHLALWSAYFSGFEKENRAFDAAFFQPASSRTSLAGLVFDHTYRGKPIYIHFPSYFTVWKRGIATTKIVDYRFGLVRRKPGGKRLPSYREWIGRTDGSGGLYAEMELLLARGSPPSRALHHLAGRPLIREQPPWRLYGPRGR